MSSNKLQLFLKQNSGYYPFYRANDLSKQEAETLLEAMNELYFLQVPVEKMDPGGIRLEPSANENPARFCALSAEYSRISENISESSTEFEWFCRADQAYSQIIAIREKIPERYYFLIDHGRGDELIAVIDDLSRAEIETLAATLEEPMYQCGWHFSYRAERTCRAPYIMELRLQEMDLEENGFTPDSDDPRSLAINMYWQYREQLEKCRDTLPDWDDNLEEWLEEVKERDNHKDSEKNSPDEAPNQKQFMTDSPDSLADNQYTPEQNGKTGEEKTVRHWTEDVPDSLRIPVECLVDLLPKLGSVFDCAKRLDDVAELSWEEATQEIRKSLESIGANYEKINLRLDLRSVSVDFMACCFVHAWSKFYKHLPEIAAAEKEFISVARTPFQVGDTSRASAYSYMFDFMAEVFGEMTETLSSIRSEEGHEEIAPEEYSKDSIYRDFCKYWKDAVKNLLMIQTPSEKDWQKTVACMQQELCWVAERQFADKAHKPATFPDVNKNQPQPTPRLIVDMQKDCAFYDGTKYDLSGDQGYFLNCLIEANGVWRSSTEMNITKPDRLKNKLPEPIRDLIESQTGKGYQIPRERLWDS